VLDGDPSPLPQEAVPPIFGPHLLWPNGCMDQGATWYGGRPRFRDIVLDGDPAPPRLKGHSPSIFGPCLLWPNGLMDYDATWYEGRPRPRRLCSMGIQLPPEKAHTHPRPIFGPCLLWPNGWIDEDATSYGSRPRPRPHCIRRGPSSRERGTAAPSLFGLGLCLLGPRSPISATAELLLFLRF